MSLQRNFGLDLIRSVAIILVLIHHFTPFASECLPFEDHYLTVLGYYGVEIFFVLSGFLIGNIIIKIYNNNDRFSLGDIVNFWTRRWLRTIPLYYVILMLTVILFIYVGKSIDNLWHFPIFIQNIFGSYNVFFEISWSLAIEEWYYLTFPLALYIATKMLKRWCSNQKILLITILFYIVTFLLLKIVYSYYYSTHWNIDIRKNTLLRLDSIVFGVAVSYIFNFYRSFWDSSKKIFAIVGFIVTGFCIFYFLKYISYDYFHKTFDTPFFGKTFYFPLVNIGIALLFPLTYYYDIKSSYIKIAVTHISKISYSLYLVHPFVIKFNNRVLIINDEMWRLVIGLLVYFTLSIIISTFTYRWIELPFLGIREKKIKERIGVKQFKTKDKIKSNLDQVIS